MSEPQRPNRRQTETLPPGAERFWGQVSETKAGRTHAEEEPPAPEPRESQEESQHCLEWCPICRSADVVRATTSPDAISQVQAIQNEAVGVLRSFLALYAERSGQSDERSGQSDGGGTARTAEPASGEGPGPQQRHGSEVRDISID